MIHHSVARPAIVGMFCVVVLSGSVACSGGADGGADTDARADAGVDAGEHEDAAPEGCDPEAVAREQVGSIETVAEGSVDIQENSGVFSGSIAAPAGGLENADDSSFLYVDLDEGKRLNLSDAEAFENEQWDIAFRRTEIRLNGADSGPGFWYLTDVDKSWENLQDSPSRDADWRQDDFVADDCSLETFGRGSLKTAFGQWYDYDQSTHQVSAPDDAVWALYQVSSHTVLKFEIQSYSDATYQVRWTDI